MHVRYMLLAVMLVMAVPPVVSGQQLSRIVPALESLRHALARHDVVAVQEFMTRFGNVNQSDGDGLTLMHYAALQGLTPVIALLRQLGASNALSDARGLLPYDYAVFGGHLETQRLLQQIEPAAVDIFTAAANNAQRALARLLAEPDLNIDARTVAEQTALHLSAAQGHVYATQSLLAAGANVLAKDKDGSMALDLAIAGEHAAVVSLLLEAVGIDEKEHKGWTALNWAVLSGDRARVRQLLARGAKVGEGCQNAIEVCLVLQDMEMFAIVQAAGGIDAASSRGDTALMGAVRRGDENVVDALLTHGAKVNVADLRHGYNPLRLASEGGHLAILQKLIAHGAKLNAVDRLGDTALIRAALRGNVEVVRVLSHAGAELDRQGAGGMTALMWATYWDERDTVKVLLAGGADVSLLNAAGISALEWAVRRNNEAMVRILLAHIDLNSHTGQGDVRRALEQADQRGEAKELQKILRAHLDEPFGTAPQVRHEPNYLLRGMLIAAQGQDVDYDTRLAVAQEHADFPLQWLIAAQEMIVVTKVLELRLNLNLDARDRHGVTPVLQALRHGSYALETLLSHGADPNYVGGSSIPPIVVAAEHGDKDAVKTLLAWRADRNARTADGATALMRAAAGGYFELVELLLLEGADPLPRNDNKEDALDLALKGGYHDIAAMLKAAEDER